MRNINDMYYSTVEYKKYNTVNKIRQDATVRRYLFTVKSLYMFRVSNVALGHIGGRLLPRYYDLYQRLQLQFYVLLTMGAMDTWHM
jgi:hypothetical protein